MAIDVTDSAVLRDHFLFSGLSDAERADILDRAETRVCGAGEVILTEGEPNSRLFIVLGGEVEVLKLEPTTKMVLPLSAISEGGLFGELSFFNAAPCTATVKAIGEATLLVLDRTAFQAGSPAYDNLVASMAGTNLARLDATNAKYVKSAVDYLVALRTQNEFGKFFIITIVTFGLGNLLNRIVNDYVIDTTTDLYSWAYLLIILTPILYFVLYFKYPLSMFGVHLRKWRASLRDGVVSGAIGVFLFLGGYWLVNRLLGHPLERNLLAISDPRLLSPTVVLYLGHSYVQEFIARGVIQTSLQKFLNEASGRQTVMLTSFLFGVFHLHISIVFSLIVFVGSVVFGFLYLRTENLIGVSILHWLLGLASIQAGLM
jgi:membrane protease YdiL (CAAX protease family)